MIIFHDGSEGQLCLKNTVKQNKSRRYLKNNKNNNDLINTLCQNKYLDMQKLMHFLYMDQPISQCFISVGTRGGCWGMGLVYVFFNIYFSKDSH